MGTETLKNKILLVSWTLYPWPSGSSVIVNNIAEQFSRDELVLMGEEWNQDEVPNLSEQHPKIYYVNPNLIKGRGKIMSRMLKIPSTTKSICKIIEDEKITKLLCVFPDDHFLISSWLASRIMKIPLYTWFHNTYKDNYSGYRKQIAKWIQPKVFQHARKMFVMSDGMLNFYKSQYPKYKFKTLVHGFPLPIREYEEYHLSKNKVKFVFTGSLNESCRDAAVRLMSTILNSPDHELHLYTGNPLSDFEQYGIKGENVVYHGFISLENLYAKLREYDIMLLPHGFEGSRSDEEFQTIFPTRTIPYLCSNRPILAHSPKGVFLTEFLEAKECAFIVDEKNVDKIEQTIQAIKFDHIARNKTIKNALKTAEMFDVKTIAGIIKEEILRDLN